MTLSLTQAARAQHPSGIDWHADSWMSHLPDDALVSQLSLPGAHDAATAEGWAGVLGLLAGDTNSKTQEVKVAEQYNGGVRVFDIRPCLENDVLWNSHGVTRLNKTIESLLDDMVAFLEKNPSEFFIFHVYQGGDGWQAAPKLSEMLKSDKYKARVASFRNTLTVANMRGKMLFLCRHDHDNNPWPGGYLRNWSELNYEESKSAYINAGGTNNYDFNTQASTLYIQDMAGTEGKGEVEKKMQSIGRLLDFTTHHWVRQAGQTVWTFNFASACKQTSLGVSLSDGYRDNATYTNKFILDYLTAEDYKPGPTGMIMMDYACVETTKFRSNRYSTNGNTVYGKQLVEAIIDNNFRCSHEQLCLTTAKTTQPVSFSKTANIRSSAHSTTMPTGNLLMPEQKGYAIWGDFNNDGNMDFYYSGISKCHAGKAFPSLVINNGGGKLTFSYQDNGLPIGTYGMGSRTLDFDQDGYIDFLFLNRGGNNTTHDDYITGNETTTGELLLVRNNGDSTFSVIPDEALRNIGFDLGDEMEWNNGRKATILSVGDYDRDSYPDIVVQGTGLGGSFVKVLRCDSGKGFCLAQSLEGQSDGGVSFADFDGDGWLDIVSTGSGANGPELRIYRGTGDRDVPFADITSQVIAASGFRSEEDFHHLFGATESSIVVLDHNQDGRQDIFLNGSNHNQNAKLSMVLTNTTPAGSTVFSFTPLSSGIAPVALASDRLFCFADLNGDDCVDAIQQGWSSNGRNWTYAISYTNGSVESYYNRNFTDPANSGIGATFTEEGNVSLGDFNGDGRLDIACIGNTSRGENAEIYYNTSRNGSPQAPASPEEVYAEYDGEGNVVVRWKASQLAVSGGCPMYNLYIKDAESGKTQMMVPADTETGTQKGYAAFSEYVVTPESDPAYTFKGKECKDYIIGVQAVSYNYAASPFEAITLSPDGVVTKIQKAGAIGHTAGSGTYNLLGQRLNGQPNRPGIYISGGRKVLHSLH